MDAIQRAATWSGWPLRDRQLSLLRELGSWLRREAIPQGALGPNEGERLERRHLADSLLFAAAWSPPVAPPAVADLGSGAGLPGLPLAVLWPDSRVHLVERSGRRADLLRRAVRVLDMQNVTVQGTAAERVELHVDMVVSRAAGPPSKVVEWGRRLLRPGGILVLGGSWQEPPEPGPGEEVLLVPPGVLDRPVWLRIMAAA